MKVLITCPTFLILNVANKFDQTNENRASIQDFRFLKRKMNLKSKKITSELITLSR